MKKNRLISLFLLNLLIGQNSEIIKKAAQASGYDESEIKLIAKERNLSDSDIQLEAKKRGFDLKSNEIGDASSNENSKKRSFSPIEKIEKEKIKVVKEKPKNKIQNELLVGKNLEKQTTLSFFGYNIFENDPSVFQDVKYGSVDPKYNIGPGDEIIIMLWGETQFREKFFVDREGYVFLPDNIGQVFVNGLNLESLEKKLYKLLSKAYSSLKNSDDRATTFLDVSLGALRPLRITVLGEVNQPGTYSLSPSTSLFTSLYYFGGPTTKGSLRDIQLIRNGEKIASIDYYNFLLTGKATNDIRLQMDDVIFISKRISSVEIEGEVRTNAIYEIKENENLSDLLRISGGLKSTAYLDRAQIHRIVPFDERKKIKNDRIIQDFDLNKFINKKDTLKIIDGDKIKIFAIKEGYKNDVSIEGVSVSRPGKYELSKGMRVLDLISRAGGVSGKTYFRKANIIRSKSNDIKKELITINLEEALKGDEIHNILLNLKDRLLIFSYENMVPEYSVLLNGHVKFPGTYNLIDSMTVYDLIFQFGGFLDNELKKRTFLDRAEIIRVSNDGDEKQIIPFNLGQLLIGQVDDILLNPDDEVRVYSLEDIEGAEQYVEISGNVKNPGKYELYKDNMTIYDLVFKTAGLDDSLFIATTYTKRADLYRFNDDRSEKYIKSFNLDTLSKNKNTKDNFILESGDQIKIYPKSFFQLKKTVIINGLVGKPGQYEFKRDMTLKDLILEAGGYKVKSPRIKVEVSRIDPTNTDLKVFSKLIDVNATMDSSYFNSESLLNSDSMKFTVEPFDIVSVRPDPFYREQRFVKVSGSIKYPGFYALSSSSETISSIIDRAGGILPSAYLKASKFIREENEISLSLEKTMGLRSLRHNIRLEPGDQIIINSKSQVVTLIGEVNNPGKKLFKKGKRMKYYIKNSGGYTKNADRGTIWVTHPNGDAKKYSRFSLFGQKVYDSSIITISKKEEEEPLDKTELAKELASIFADFAQVLSLIALAR